ncbi:hypothetical protein [Pseudofrankia sp. BMG5.36]|uniref:hypothetical protein n=1 Tax=Pseudofrankia sp. BMG5.36 TaxID=1834512 RepID=UPI000A709E99|nr:hypothetical protein [Pseudofrankia sp. BMG5.36]
MPMATVPGPRGRPARTEWECASGGPRVALALPALVAVVVLAACGADTDTATPPPATSPSQATPAVRPAVAAAPDLATVMSVSAVNDSGAMVVGRAGPAGAEFYYLAHGARPIPLTHDGAPIEPSLLNNAGQVVGVVADPAGHQPPSLVRWQDGHSTVLPVHGGQVIPEDLNDRGQVTAVAVASRPGTAQGTDRATTARAYLTDGTTTVDLGVDPDLNEHNLYLNEAGQVVGLAFEDSGTSPHGFLWDQGRLTTFDTGPTTHPVVTGINDAGQIAGLVLDDQDSPSGAHPIFRPAFRWQSGTMTALAAGADGVGPVRINHSGQVAGVVADPSGSSRDVVVWSATADAKPTRLGIADADLVVDIDDRGDVLVSALTGPTASPGGYLWHDGRIVVLGTLGGLAVDPTGLAADGLVAGQSTSADGTWHAAIWPPIG